MQIEHSVAPRCGIACSFFLGREDGHFAEEQKAHKATPRIKQNKIN